MTPDTRTTENREPRTEAGRRLITMLAQIDPEPQGIGWVNDAILAIEAEAAQGAAPLDVSDRDKTVENLIIALAYRYDDDERGTPCFCATGGDAVDGRGRIISHTPRCRSARLTLDKWSEGAAPRAEGLDANWLSDELGMHQFVNDRQCDCGDWDTFRDKGTFNDHVAAEIVARLSERRDKEGTE